MRQKNPSMVDRKTKLVMKPPQVMRVGAKRTSFANFTEICKLLVNFITSFCVHVDLIPYGGHFGGDLMCLFWCFDTHLPK